MKARKIPATIEVREKLGVQWRLRGGAGFPTDEEIMDAGFDPKDENLRYGMLPKDWNGHRKGAKLFWGRTRRRCHRDPCPRCLGPRSQADPLPPPSCAGRRCQR